MEARTALDLHIRARYPILYLPTAEEERAEDDIRAVAEAFRPGWRVYVWDAVTGFHGVEGSRGLPLPALEYIAGQTEQPALFILRDFHLYLRDAQVSRHLRNLATELRSRRQTIILLSPVLEIPPTLAEDIHLL